MFCGFVYLVGWLVVFFISKQNTHGEGFVFGLTLLLVLLISPGPHRLRNQQKDTAG